MTVVCVLFSNGDDSALGPGSQLELWLWGPQAIGVQCPERKGGRRAVTDPGLEVSTQLLQQSGTWDATGSSWGGQRESGSRSVKRGLCTQGGGPQLLLLFYLQRNSARQKRAWKDV